MKPRQQTKLLKQSGVVGGATRVVRGGEGGENDAKDSEFGGEREILIV